MLTHAQSVVKNATQRVFNPVMAFNDVRISGARHDKMMTFERNMIPNKKPARNNLMSLTQNKDRAVKGEERDLKADA